MMTLSTMWRGARQVDAAGGAPAASLVMAHWPHDPASCAPFRYSSNFLFTFTDAGEQRFLRVAADEERGRPAIDAELALLTWLAGEGITVATPLLSKRGKLVETIAGEDGVFHGVAFPAVAGETRAIEDLDDAGFMAWGAALGRLHTTLRGYHGAGIDARWSWRDQVALIMAHVPPGETVLRREAETLAGALAAMPAGPDQVGLIHFDFELDNLLWSADGIGIIDFDDCARHWYAADIAFALRDLFDQGAGLADRRAGAFLAGYAAHQPVDDTLRTALPVFSRMARLTTYARIVRALDLPADATLPSWLEDLQRRLRSRADRYHSWLAS